MPPEGSGTNLSSQSDPLDRLLCLQNSHPPFIRKGEVGVMLVTFPAFEAVSLQ